LETAKILWILPNNGQKMDEEKTYLNGLAVRSLVQIKKKTQKTYRSMSTRVTSIFKDPNHSKCNI